MALVVGIDIGTTKVCCIAAEVQTDLSLNVVGFGLTPCKGLQRGVVVDLEQTVYAIEQAVQEVQTMCGQPIESAYVGVTGDHIQSHNRRAEISITRPDREITDADVERLREQIRTMALPPDREILHVITRQYLVDGQPGVVNPIGMSGTHLEADAHVVTAGVTFLQNVQRCVERAGLRIEQMVLEPLAAAMAVLTSEEREVGVALVDIGGGTSDVAIFYQGGIYHSGVVSLGGNHVTRDVYLLFRTAAPEEAERIKKEAGSVLPSLVPENEAVAYSEMGTMVERKIPRKLLAEVIEARVREILELVRDEIHRSDRASTLAAGIVLTGGGSCLSGTVELAREVFDSLPVRQGIPVRSMSGLAQKVREPAYATAVGLVLYGANYVHGHARQHAGQGRWKQVIAWFKRRLPQRSY